jgi:plasmid stabilization system protein ParE
MQSYRVIITPRAGFRVIDEDKVVRILTVRHGAQRRPRRFD